MNIIPLALFVLITFSSDILIPDSITPVNLGRLLQQEESKPGISTLDHDVGASNDLIKHRRSLQFDQYHGGGTGPSGTGGSGTGGSGTGTGGSGTNYHANYVTEYPWTGLPMEVWAHVDLGAWWILNQMAPPCVLGRRYSQFKFGCVEYDNSGFGRRSLRGGSPLEESTSAISTLEHDGRRSLSYYFGNHVWTSVPMEIWAEVDLWSWWMLNQMPPPCALGRRYSQFKPGCVEYGSGAGGSTTSSGEDGNGWP